MKKTPFIFVGLLLTLLIFGSAPAPTTWLGHAEEETKSPSAYTDPDFKWLFETAGYTSDNQYAQMGTVSEGFHEIQYYNYGFGDLGNYSIDEVTIFVEHKSSVYPDDVCEIRLSRNGGSSWGNWVDVPVEPLDWTYEIDVTEYFDWNAEDFSNENFRVSLHADIESSGCYFWKSEVSLWESEKFVDFQMPIKLIADVKKGDVLLGYNLTTGEYIPNIMLSDAIIDKSKAFTFYYIIMEYPAELWDQEIYPWENPKELLRKDVCVTEEQSLYTLEKGKIRADEVEVGMHLHGLFRRDGRMVNTPIKIISIETFEDYGAVTLDGTSEIIFTHYMLAKTTKTYYLDHIPVKVVFSELGEEEFDCKWIGVNNTVAGLPTKFSSDWTDLNASKGLSYYLFSIKNGEEPWQNDTWTDAWVDQNWTEAIKPLNETVGLNVAFRFFVNDSLGQEYPSSICFFTTEAPIVEDHWTIGIVYGVTGGFIFGIMMIAVLASRVRDENE